MFPVSSVTNVPGLYPAWNELSGTITLQRGGSTCASLRSGALPRAPPFCVPLHASPQSRATSADSWTCEQIVSGCTSRYTASDNDGTHSWLQFRSSTAEPQDRVGRMVYHPRLGWIPSPGRFGSVWTSNVDASSVRSNGRSISTASRPVLAVGDSFTFGDEVEDGETWAAHLEAILNTRVLNAVPRGPAPRGSRSFQGLRRALGYSVLADPLSGSTAMVKMSALTSSFVWTVS